VTPQDFLDNSEPLTSRRQSITQAASAVARYAAAATKSSPVFCSSHHNKVLIYDHDALLTSRCIFNIGRSVFAQKPVLHALAYCSFLAGSATLVVLFIPKASKFDTEKFESFGNFLKLFISFMLGVYVQNGFKRWWKTVTTYEKILLGIRQLAFMLHTIRATPASRKLIESYCIASGYILNVEVHNSQILDKKKHASVCDVYAWLVAQGMLTEDESAQLQKNPSHNLSSTRAIWSWIGELVAHPEVEEGITILPALRLRTIMMCQSCISEIENLKMNIAMQTPFMYSQLLALLVAVNNIILSLSCGMALGSSMIEIRRRAEQLSGDHDHSLGSSVQADFDEHQSLWRSSDSHQRHLELIGQFYEAMQTLGMQLVIVLLAPMIYVGFFTSRTSSATRSAMSVTTCLQRHSWQGSIRS